MVSKNSRMLIKEFGAVVDLAVNDHPKIVLGVVLRDLVVCVNFAHCFFGIWLDGIRRERNL